MQPCDKPGACPTGVPGGPQCYKIMRPVVGEVEVAFNASPAAVGDCFSVTDMLGRPGVPAPRVCAVDGVHGATGEGTGPAGGVVVPTLRLTLPGLSSGGGVARGGGGGGDMSGGWPVYLLPEA